MTLILRRIPESPNDDYRAGSDGQIYSRTQYAGFGRKIYVDWYALKGHLNEKGYASVSLCHNSIKVTKSVHRLICSAFHGIPNPKNLQVRHLNGIEKDNRPSNLKWGTQAENWMDRKAHGHGINGEKHPMSKLSDLERSHIRWMVEKGFCSRHHIARVMGLTQACISSVCRTK